MFQFFLPFVFVGARWSFDMICYDLTRWLGRRSKPSNTTTESRHDLRKLLNVTMNVGPHFSLGLLKITPNKGLKMLVVFSKSFCSVMFIYLSQALLRSIWKSAFECTRRTVVGWQNNLGYVSPGYWRNIGRVTIGINNDKYKLHTFCII